MNKKEIFSLILAVALIAGVLIFAKLNRPVPMPIHGITGEVMNVNGSMLTVSGLVGEKEKTVEFNITDATALNKAVLVITPEKLKASGPFTPDTEKREGSMSDLASGKSVVIYSQEDLLKTNKATATRIDYASFDLPESLGFADVN